MAGFKRSQIGLRQAGERITQDEEDQYLIYNISSPGTSANWFGTSNVAGTSSLGTVGIINRYADYPRNLNYTLVGTGAGMAGTFIVSGVDQFGNTVSETVATGTASNGGTVVGTQIFAQFTGGTVQYGTAIGNGTPLIGFVPGTGCLFGLPVPIGGTKDVVFASMVAGTGVISWNGGTVGGFVGVTSPLSGTPPVATIRAVAALTGSQTINVWIKPTYIPDNIAIVANLKQ